ncbi:MAG: heat-shock protein Hsp20 [Bacillales bacterium]|jgi:HSP20 family protein|nr:heat-shock protein Hsp20 [Bacillales bacterium]
MFSPFQDPTAWRKQMDMFFGESFWKKFEPHFQPGSTQVNIYENEQEVLCVLALPGLLKVDNIDVNVEDNHIVLHGEIIVKYDNFNIKEEGIYQGSFDRSIVLPTAVDAKGIKREYENGLLKLTFKRLNNAPASYKSFKDVSTSRENI